MKHETSIALGTGRTGLFRSTILIGTILAVALLLGAWRYSAALEASAAAANQQEPMETVAVAVASERQHRRTTTSIGTVLALRSISLRNEIPGTVRHVTLAPGQVVNEGAVLVALDVTVEEAELKALEAQAALAQTLFTRLERMAARRAASTTELDNARAERDVAVAQIARTEAIIERKTIRAPFRARVGIADVHPGQFLEAGSLLTTLQGVDAGAHVDFEVAQSVAAGLRAGDRIRVVAGDAATTVEARIVAIDARIDPTTRNATVRARFERDARGPAPGASVRVEVPVGQSTQAIVVPVSALRRGPGGDHVFVLAAGEDGKLRAQLRQVTSGAVIGDEVVILRGLALNEQVAASGSFKLRDAVLVAIAAH